MAQGGLSNADFTRFVNEQARVETIETSKVNDTESSEDFLKQFTSEKYNSNSDPITTKGNNGQPSAQPRKTSTNTQGKLGSWEKHTKGFGKKMLERMGFNGRLGKEEQGSAKVVEVIQRPKEMGIGFSDLDKKSKLHKKDRSMRDTPENSKLQSDDFDGDKLWRKRKVDGSRYSKKRCLDNFTEQIVSMKKKEELILDMRGPDVQLLSNINDAYDVEHCKHLNKVPKLGEELIYNVHLSISLIEGTTNDLHEKVRASTEQSASVRKETRLLQSSLERNRVNIQSMKILLTRLKDLDATLDLPAYDIVAKVVPALQSIRIEFPLEFDTNKLCNLIPSLVIPPLKYQLKDCNVLIGAENESLLKQYHMLHLFLLENKYERSNNTPGQNKTFASCRYKFEYGELDSSGYTMYNHILEETLWGALAQCIASRWDVSDSDLCISFHKKFRPFFTDAFDEAFLQKLVIPRLQRACRQWASDYQSSSISILAWLSPWEKLLGEGMHTLYDDVRSSLGRVLSTWHPSDTSILDHIAPWRPIWGESVYAKFTHQYLVRRLVRTLRHELVIDPKNQSLQVLKWILVWKDCLPERQLIALIEGEFFPRWLKVLRNWILGKPNVNELAQWYSGWKRFFARQKLATHARLLIHFHGALILLESLCVGPEIVVPNLSCLAPKSYEEALLLSAGKDELSRDDKPTYSKLQTKERFTCESLRMRDVIEHLAIQHDVLFMPKTMHDGQQVYAFGAHRIRIEQGIVFVEKASGTFSPVDVEQLIKTA